MYAIANLFHTWMTHLYSNPYLVKLFDILKLSVFLWWLRKISCIFASQKLIWALQAQFQIWMSGLKVWYQPCKFSPSVSIYIKYLYYMISELIPYKERLWFLNYQKMHSQQRLLNIIAYYLIIETTIFHFFTMTLSHKHIS